MKLLFATTNPAKINKYKEKLIKYDIDLISLNDIDEKIKIEENGKNSIENAYIKAKACYDKTGIPSIGMDNSLFIDDIPEDKQIGTHVRRVNGKTLTDDEMIEYYTSFVKEHVGKLIAKWVYGMVFCGKKGKREFLWSKKNFHFVDTPSKLRNPGYPLDSITIVPEYNKYLVELSSEERKNNDNQTKDDEVIDFIKNSLLNEI